MLVYQRNTNVVGLPQGNTRRASIVGRIRARDQFVALAAGALVERCGRNSPVRGALPQSFWCEFGRSWVLSVARQFGTILELELPGDRGATHRVNVWVDVSPTGGTLACGCCDYRRESYSSYGAIVGCIGGGMHVTKWDWRTIRVVDGEMRTVMSHSWPEKSVSSIIACSNRWIVVVVTDCGDENQIMEVWRVGMNGKPVGDSDSVRVIPRLARSFLWGRHCCLQGDTLVVVGSREVWFIDLVRSTHENALAISRKQQFPPSVEIILSNPITTTQPEKDDDDYVRLTSGGVSAVFNRCWEISYIAEDLICTHVDFPMKINRYYQLPNLAKPVLSVPCGDIIETVPKEPRPGVVAVISGDDPSRISIIDVASASVLAFVSI
ncbi:hypothetical protein Pelo_8381 [Pelomyxa schiedti]|nr:hypothetical protein Pelo_8381 [Pelomyxa schiedti]